MRKPSAATVIATVALFVALGGAGIAANGQGLILGQSNTATANTSLSAPVAGGKALQLTNNDTSNAASTALGLNVASGHAPFTVNTGIKVPSLNADKLDGIDSTGFLPKTGTAANSAKLGGQLPGYYLPKTGKAADADKLDSLDSSAFLPSQRFGGAQGSDKRFGGAGLGHSCALAEVTLFAGTFAPTGWDFAHGQILRTDMNQALFSLLGSTYGGNGTTTFALPNLSGLEPDGVNYIVCTAGVFPS